MQSFPLSLLNQLKQLPDFDTASFLEAHKRPAVTSIRMHRDKKMTREVVGSPVPWCNEGIYLPQRPVFTLDPAFHGGAYYVQEASSMFLDYMFRTVMPERDNLRVLDLCAAPGGKSTLLASAIGQGSLLISNEVIRTRASILEENMTRWGYLNTWVTSNDPRDFGKLPGYFDAMVVDAPCSGSGLFRKDARALDEWSEGNVALCSQRQQRILADVWPALKEEGVLIYATCSYSKEEDEQILDWLAGEYDVEGIAVPVPDDWGILTTVSPQHGMTGYRFMPNRLEGEGFFIAALRKKESTEAMRPVKFRTAHDKKVWQQAAYLVKEDQELVCLKSDKEGYFAVRADQEADRLLLQKAVFLRKTGLTLGAPSAKEWLPDHEVALAVDRNPGLPMVNVDKEQALKFLKKEEMDLGSVAKGWHLIGYEGLGLGWVKSLGNRFNNYLPKHWRIRMEISDADWA